MAGMLRPVDGEGCVDGGGVQGGHQQQVQHYTLLPETAGRVPEEAWQLGVTSLPAPFKLRLVQRAG